MDMPDLERLNPRVTRCLNTALACSQLKQNFYPQRLVRSYELELIIGGGGYIVTDGRKLPAEPGTVFIRAPGMLVQGFLPYNGFCMIFELPEIGPDKTGPASLANLPARIDFQQHLAVLFQNAYEAYLTADPYNQLLLKAIVLQILHQLLQSSRRIASGSETNDGRISQVVNYIDTHFAQPLTLPHLATVSHFSEGFLCRLFKRVKGLTLTQYIHQVRVQQSRLLLIETDWPIKEICNRCGFVNESYYYRIFKAQMDLSPAEYRKLHRQPYS